ncbi:hypothetical protein [Bradyrhizobium sp. TM233]|uniref:hypothetical protein n=1 Tax=Bradyrhizobium sp. TM233 TaxID=2599801 RepID=UPI0027D635F5|nr:hypothetical protein TM233_21680 [Bradyrhizobium sp. TM233]
MKGAIRRGSLSAAATVALALPAFAQEQPAPTFEKWRPKAGVYAEPGKSFQSNCDESGGLTIDLSRKSVSGYEWVCKVKNINDLGPGSLKVDMVCDDYNLAQNLNPRDPNWDSRRFNEIMFIKQLDPAAISVQKSLNGKLKDPPWRAAYCPPKTQRALTEATLRAKAEARQKAEEAKRKAEVELTLKSAHPQDGVYAAAGADFEERCANFSDTVVAFARKSIVTASNRCEIFRTRVQLPDTVRIGADCTLQPASDRDAVSVPNVDTAPERENLMFKKTDDRTVILWIIKDGHFTGDGRKLSYCGDQVQRAYARQRRTGKQTGN